MIEVPNIILISGGGQNVGKTSFACSIISEYSNKNEIVGIKISPHFHEISKDASVLFLNPNAVIIRETNFNSLKDSSLMLQAGASEVFYVQTNDLFLKEIVPILLEYIKGRLCVCESGGLRAFVKPGLHIYITKNTIQEKDSQKELADSIITNFDFSQISVTCTKNQWKLL